MNNQVWKIIIALVIGLLIGYFVGVERAQAPLTDDKNNAGEVGDEEASESGDSSKPAASDNTSGVMVGENAVAVFDQPPGNMVVVTSIVLKSRSWVVIHEDRDGAPGNILGAQRFLAGTSSGQVELLRSTIEGGKYYAMIHADDGDGVFDHTKDLPLKDPLGNVLTAEFTARASVELPAAISL